jgi:hypothetical protein
VFDIGGKAGTAFRREGVGVDIEKSSNIAKDRRFSQAA